MSQDKAKICGSFVCKDHPFRVIREQENYSFHYFSIRNGLQLRATLRAGPCAMPGVYPIFFVTSDGAALSYHTVKENLEEITRAIRNKLNNGWRVCNVDINWENPDLHCDVSGERIRSAYAEED